LFVNRADCYCIQKARGYVKVEQPLTDEVLRQHLAGKITVGSYQLDKQSLVKWLCFDLDPEKLESPEETAKQILNVCFEQKVEADGKKRPRIWEKAVLLEASRYPDPSFHIWIFFEPKVPAKVARWLGYRILELANLNPKQIEVFPKQSELTEANPYGNFVKFPLGKHQVAGKWSRLLDFETFKPISNEALFNVQGISFSEVDLARITGFEEKKNVQLQLNLPKKFKPVKDKEEEKIVNFLLKYWRKGQRNQVEFAFLGWAIKKGISFESAFRIIKRVAELTGDEEKAQRLQLVKYHYQNRRSLGAKLLGISGLREIVREAVA